MAQPLLQLLRAQHPDWPIDVLAPAWVAPVWRAMAQVDSVLEAPFRHGALQLRERWRYARLLRKRDYAAAYVLPNTLKFALIPWLAGIARRIGYLGEQRHILLNVIHHDSGAQKRAMVPFYAALALPPAAAAPADLPRPALRVTTAQVDGVLEALQLTRARPLVVFAPGAEFGSAKRWPATHFAALADLVQAWHPGTQVVLLGSGKDQPVCEDIVALAPAVRNLAGSTSLAQAIALIGAAAAMVSNDSGLLHIASALNRPIVALYGPTSPEHAPPFSDLAVSLSLRLDCSPCRQRECPLGHHHCMEHMTAATVWQSLQPMLVAPGLDAGVGHAGTA
ncbi:MAG: lipopolysaccharide heptosyltransferase II [Janthinobacterium lividum]